MDVSQVDEWSQGQEWNIYETGEWDQGQEWGEDYSFSFGHFDEVSRGAPTLSKHYEVSADDCFMVQPPIPAGNFKGGAQERWVMHGKRMNERVKHVKSVNYLQRESRLDEVSGGNQEGWERITLKIDSGAIDTVIPPSVAKAFPTKSTAASRAGIGYRAANGSKIAAFGERQVKGVTDDWLPFNIKTQVAGVKSPLGSVMHMIKAGQICA